MFSLPERGHHDFAQQGGAGEWRSVRLLGRAGCAHNLVGGDASLLARKLIAPARTSRSPENAVAHQRLEHRLKVSWGQTMATGQCLGRNGTTARVERDVDNGGNGQGAFVRQKGHDVSHAEKPVPKLVAPLFPSRARRTKTP